MKVKIDASSELISQEARQKNIEQIKEIEERVYGLQNELAKIASPDQVKQWLLDLCSASNIKELKDGTQINDPNWAARRDGLDRVIEILQYKHLQSEVHIKPSPTKILIQVIESDKKNDDKVIDTNENIGTLPG